MVEFNLEEHNEVCEPEAVYAVNRELNLAWEIIEETGANLFLTGRAGTGKTTFLKKLRESSTKNMVVLAPTGVAAINASGSTIHSFFQFPLSPYLPGKGFISEQKKYFALSKQKRRMFLSLSLLVIDEISMVRPDILDAIDNFMRRIRSNSLPFGGVQLLLIGDLRQLPPVIKDEEWALLKEYYPSPYFFESHALRNAGYQTVELSIVYRQTDNIFLDILNKIRDGKANSATLTELNDRCNIPVPDDNGFIRLTTHNHRAALINNAQLAALPSSEWEYKAEVVGTFPETSFPAEKRLILKVGAQVMFIKNDAGGARRYYNGLIGHVTSLSEDKIKVKVPGAKQEIDVCRAEWENTRYKIDETSKNIIQEQIGNFRQFPLQLAWGITIHKSQGLTFEKAIIDAAYSFAPGQTYVALSRCRSLEGLRLEAPIPPQAVITDPEISKFVKYCEENSPTSSIVSSLKEAYQFNLFIDLFDFSPIRASYDEFFRVALEFIVPKKPELEGKLDDIRNKIENDIWKTAIKFTSTFNIESLSGKLADANSPLYERIKKGAEYFSNILEEIEFFLRTLPKNIGNQRKAERLDRIYDNLFYLIRLKLFILSAMSKAGFSISFYLGVKAKGALTIERKDQVSRLTSKSSPSGRRRRNRE